MGKLSSADHPLAASQDEALHGIFVEALQVLLETQHHAVGQTLDLAPESDDGLFPYDAPSATAMEIIHLVLRRLIDRSEPDVRCASAIFAEGMAGIIRPGSGVLAIVGNLDRKLKPIEAALARELAPGQSILLALEDDERVTGHQRLASSVFLRKLGRTAVQQLRHLGRCDDASILSVEHAGSIIILRDLDSWSKADHAFPVGPASARLELVPVPLTPKQKRALDLARDHALVTPGRATPRFLDANPDAWVIEASVVAALQRRGLIHLTYVADSSRLACKGSELYVATGSERSLEFLRGKLRVKQRRP